MPIYEYRCTRCDHEFEVFQGINDEPIEKCIKCLGPVDKLISQSSFSLKGSGWYQTDYANKGKTDPAEKKCNPVDKKCSGCPSAN